MTGSSIGFYHYIDESTQNIILQQWSTKTVKEFCKAEGYGLHYGIDKGGVWTDCVRERRPIIHNDYASLPHKKGMPEGHAQVVRELVVPIFRKDKIVAILGIGNKQQDYTETDIELVTFFADYAWDIAVHKQSEQYVRQSEAHFRSLFDNSLVGIAVTDNNFIFTEANDALCKMMEYSRDELVGKKTISELSHPDDVDRSIDMVKKMIKKEIDHYSLEKRYIAKTGKAVTALIYIKGLYSSDGEYLGSTGSILDITERKQAEEALKNISELKGSILESISDAFFFMDNNMVVTYFNSMAEKVLGRRQEDVIGRKLFDSFPEARGSIFEKNYTKAIKEKEALSFETYFPIPPYENWFDVRVYPHDDGISVYFQLITERKLVEETIRNSEMRLSSVVETAKDGIVAINSHGKIVLWNKGAEQQFGYTAEEVMGRDMSFMVHPRYLMAHRQAISNLSTSGELKHKGKPLEFSAMRRDGSEFPIELTTAKWETSEGVFFTGIIRDITDRKLAEEKLRKSDETAHKYLNVTAQLIFSLDDKGNIVLMNDSGHRMLGYEPGELNGKNWFDTCLPKHVLEEVKGVFQKLMNGDIENVSAYENTVITKNESERLFLWHNSLLRNDDGKIYGILSSAEDITDRKKLEEQLRQSQKMEAIGTLAGGVAHDFNNILTAIIGFGVVAKKRVKDDEKTTEYIDEMLAGAKRAAELTHNLLAFSRKQTISLKQVDLNSMVKKMHGMIVRLIGEDIELQSVLVNREIPVMVDSSQIDQVLLNLITNARDAMPDGGNLVIKTAVVDIDSRHAQEHQFENPGRYAVLSVSDTGIGMDKRTQENMFEPFFTTKEVGKGTGLGLSMVYGMVKQHSGNVIVYSEPGKGTTFRIYLPMAKTETEKDMKYDEPIISGKGHTILLAEDDAHVRRITKMTLEEYGYRVIEAVNGEEAIAKYVEHFIENKEWIPLLIFDVIMPIKNGKDAYGEIRAISPDIKIIFMSGYTDDIIARKGILSEGVDFISKPIIPDVMLRKVSEVLAK